MGEEFKDSEPLGSRTVPSHSSASSDSTAPLSLDHLLTHVLPTPTPNRASFHRRTARMTVRAQPAMSPDHSAIVAEAMTLSNLAVYSKGDELGEEDTEEDGEDESSYTNNEREMSEDEGPGLEGKEEETIPEGQQQAVMAADTTVDEPLGLGYRELRRRELAVREDQVPSTFEVGQRSRSVPKHKGVDRTPPSLKWSSGSLPISSSSLVVPSPIASPVATSTATISIDEDQFLEVGRSIDRDVKELYTRPGAVKDEIFSQMYRFKSLEREQERATMTFSAIWRPILALKACAGQTNAQRAALWHAIYDI
uniref:Uncharacterized protein n=1 Tax=Tanacetum cinerariifolium TaxID=118510 RepID=A0A6L2K895_TANCI|nr:hypothetical protein [Tanacetum cinerariifolium]